MTAKIYYLRPQHRQARPEESPELPQAIEADDRSEQNEHPNAEKPVKRRWANRPLPAGRKSGLKRRLDGKTVPRKPR
jgi:hypothetical protein